MAIAFNNAGSSAITTGSIFSAANTIAGANTLILGAFTVKAGDGTLIAPPTFASVAMTKIIGTVVSDDLELWYLKNPPAGLGTMVGTLSAPPASGDILGAVSLTGVDQTTPIVGSVGTSFSGVTSGSITRTISANNWFVGAIEYNDINGTSDNTTGQLNRVKVTAGATLIELFDTNTAGTLNWTFPSSTGLIVGAEIKAAAGISNLVQSTGTANLAAGSTLVTFGANMTAGNLVVVGVTLSNALSVGTVSSVTDNQSNTYTRAVRGTISEATSVIDEEIWYAKKITGGAGTVTVNHTTDNCAVFAREYSGFDTLDVTSSATGSSTTPNTGTVTTTQARELLVVSTGDDKGATQTFTAAGAYVDMVGTTATLTDISMEDGTVGATGAQTGTLTLGAAGNWVSLFASFYKASSGGVTFKTLLGAGNT